MLNHQNPKFFLSKAFLLLLFYPRFKQCLDIDRGNDSVTSANSANSAILITLTKTICNVEHCLYFAAGQECKYAVAGKNQQ